MNILIVDDDVALVKQLNLNLKASNYNVCEAHCLESAQNKLLSKGYDFLLVDYHLGLDNGFDLFGSLGNLTQPPTVIMMTAYATKDVAIDALNIGVNHFLEKPFLPSELKSILSEKEFKGSQQVIKLDPILNLAIDEGEEIRLTDIEFKILKYFLENSNSLVTKFELHQNIYSDNVKAINAINTHLTNLKAKIPKSFARNLKTIRGKGYIFEVVT